MGFNLISLTLKRGLQLQCTTDMRASYKEDIDSLCLESRGIFVICKDNVKITSEPPVMYEQYTNLENDEWRKLLLRFYHTLEGFIQNYFERKRSKATRMGMHQDH